VSVQVRPADPTTVPGVLDIVREKFGIDRVILVGDRAMITDAHAATLKELGAGFVSALKSAQKGRQALRPEDRRRVVLIWAQDRADRRGDRARRDLRPTHHLPDQRAHNPSRRVRVQATEDGRARLPNDQRHPVAPARRSPAADKNAQTPTPDHHQPDPGQSTQTARHQARRVAKTTPTPKHRIPRPHAGFVISTLKTSG
jgi:hypothetical protein